MDAKYNPKQIEKKWQDVWSEKKIFKAKEKGNKFYALIEFPYPSADGLHVGHLRSYTAIDVVARKKRMEGYDVLFPIGFDAFGLPTENYAIKVKKNPRDITQENIKNFTRQLKGMGFSFDWERQVNTSDPKYYRWTQWIFLKLFEAGLVYQKEMPINWCPLCKIGLANEEVIGGKCERCGAVTTKKNQKQWLFKITKYADRLISDLNKVDFLEKIKLQQINWIGKSKGADIIFPIKGSNENIKVFTTRQDTLFGATYMVLSPEHELIHELEDRIENISEVKKYIEKASKKSDLERTESKEKTGVELKGIKAINPVNNEEIPIFVADYVLSSYGTGAIMAVPGHDERDWEFAKKFNLPIRKVVVKQIGSPLKNAVRRDGVFGVAIKDKKILVLYDKTVDLYRLPGGGYKGNEKSEEVIQREFKEETGYTDFSITEYLGQIQANYYAIDRKQNRYRFSKAYLIRLNSYKRQKLSKEDEKKFIPKWLSPNEIMEKFSENRESFGEEEFIKMAINKKERCFTGEGIAVNSGEYDGLASEEFKKKITAWLEKNKKGKAAVNYKLHDWIFSRQHYWGEPIPLIHCQKCGVVEVPEKDLPVELPEVEDYEPTDTGESPLSKIKDWVNVKCPKCAGPAKRETDTMPNWAGSNWYYIRYCDPHNEKEFASKKAMKHWLPVDLYNGGMEHTTLHLLYSRFWYKALYDLKLVPGPEPYQKRVSQGMILAEDGQKMSKSFNNVVNPDEVVEKFGADAVRMYEMFMGPYDQAINWSTDGLRGVRRFLDKIWRLFENKKEGNVENILHKTIKKVTEDIENLRFNTAVSQLMILVNEMLEKGANNKTLEKFLIILSPFAPHIAEELWSRPGRTESVFKEKWPSFEPKLVKEEEIEFVIQVNGKVRDRLKLSPDISEKEAKEKAMLSEKVKKYVKSEPKKVVFIRGKLINFVI